MFHIKNDERFSHSSNLLYQSLIKLMQEKDFDKITVSELSKISTVSRATIYRNFDSITDILYWKCSTQFESILKAYVLAPIHTGKKEEFLIHVFRSWNQDMTILEELIRIGRIDILYRCFKENSPIIMNYMSKEVSLSGRELEYFLSIRIGVFTAVIDTWISRKKADTAEEIVDILISQLEAAQHGSIYF